MKTIFKYMAISLFPLLAASCLNDGINLEPAAGNDAIMLDISNGQHTKAITAEDLQSTAKESYVEHVDVIIFGTQKDDVTKVHHERVQYNVQATGTKALQAKRSQFKENLTYEVFVIANSNLDEADFQAVDEMTDLYTLIQSDEDLNLTGLDAAGVPEFFLMDGRAYTSGTDAVLNDGDPSHSTELSAVLYRAAAKVVVELSAGAAVEFEQLSNDHVYHYRNLPYTTATVANSSYPHAPSLQTDQPQPKTDCIEFTAGAFGTGKLRATGYVYAYSWSKIEDETSLIINIPMTYTEDDGMGGSIETFYADNHYKIPLSRNMKFERNRYYKVSAVVNAPGSVSDFKPVTISDISYEAFPWSDFLPPIEVGNEENKPKYLQLNTNHVNMYNANEDASTLRFASSSYIPADGIELVRAYYVNYLDQEVDLSVPSNDKYNVYSSIKAVAEADVLNGAITITSPFASMSQEEIDAAVRALGKKPEVPEYPKTPENPVVTEVDAPDGNAIAAKYTVNTGSNFLRVTVTFNSSTEKFSDDKNFNDASERAQAEYDAAKAAYQKWVEWNSLTQTEKDAKIAKYNSDLASYDTKVAEYETAAGLLEDYNEKVAAIDKGSDTHGNAVRHLVFKVTNSDGQTAEFTVDQYPTLYITNEHGNYSYRSDFGGTTYNGIGTENYSGADWNSGSWNYSSVASNDWFFGSKVAVASGSSYSINYCYWTENSYGETQRMTPSISGLNNPRMYHVHVTATSSQYTIGIPRLDAQGYTESSADNSKLVSPSFMIASQLGATQPPSGIAQAKSHCEQYVEVASDGTEYDDWRLPTAAEIDIIIRHQDTSDAMAVVLSGSAYYCAYNVDNNGNVIYTKATGKNGNSSAVRCVRDAYRK